MIEVVATNLEGDRPLLWIDKYFDENRLKEVTRIENGTGHIDVTGACKDEIDDFVAFWMLDFKSYQLEDNWLHIQDIIDGYGE